MRDDSLRKKCKMGSMILIRCDSSFQIGTGHVYRDLSLAAKLRQLGLQITFCCRNLPGQIIQKITEQSFSVHILEADVTLEQELEWVRSQKPDWVVVDHYQLGYAYESELKKFTRIFAVDDVMNREHNCDVLLDQNFRNDYSHAYADLVPKTCLKLLGPQYSLLPVTMDRSQWIRNFDHKIKKVLVFFGGSDPTGEILKFYEALKKHKTQSHFHLVATASHQFYSKIQGLPNLENATWELSPQDWHGLIKNSDYYFGSTGTVTWERFFYGLPGSVVCIADNQIQIAEQLEEAGYLKYYGLSEKADYGAIIPEVDKQALDVDYCRENSRKIQGLVQSISSDVLKKIFIDGKFS